MVRPDGAAGRPPGPGRCAPAGRRDAREPGGSGVGTRRLRREPPDVGHQNGDGTALPGLTPNYEVAHATWISVSHLWDLANSTTHTWEGHGQRHQFPGIKTPPGTIWGLTYRVLTMLGEVVGLPDLPPYRGLT